ncbi:hypothetical protein G6F22_020144 [Rhizopus arrhizus]|nr:hypothetical protein G6F22_020144 [Rhizopus arrhizus]
MPPAAKAASAMSRTLACGLPSSAPRFSSSRILASMGSASSVAASACSMAPTGSSAEARHVLAKLIGGGRLRAAPREDDAGQAPGHEAGGVVGEHAVERFLQLEQRVLD